MRSPWAWLTGLICLGLGAWNPGHSEIPQRIQVNLFQADGAVSQMKVQGPFQVLQPIYLRLNPAVYTIRVFQGQLELRSGTGQFVHHPLLRAQRMVLSPLQPRGAMVVQLPDGKARQYPGQLLVSVQGRQTLRVVNQLPAKTYVTLVVSGETSPGWPLEALKAQAVLTQTRLSRYQAGDRLDDTTQQEVYLGRSHWRPEAAKAVDAVWGQQLVVQGRPLIPFYHASCAGRTSDARVFGQDRQLPGIDSVPCPYCRYAPFGRPTVTFIPAATFKQAFPGGMPAVIQRDSAARPLRVQFQNGKTQSGYAFWLALGQKLGWDKAPGLRYFLAQTASGPIKITSAGAGHGVGLCQLGAAAMARQGKTYRLILKHYFPHATLMLH